MKGRDSGMPPEEVWQTFFHSDCVVRKLCALKFGACVAEFGSGYGTFTIPAAQATRGTVYAIDIDADQIRHLATQARARRLTNVVSVHRDFMEAGTGLASGSVDHVMAYNILHIEEPHKLLTEAFRILRPGGAISIIHWRTDIATPRGPALDIRPTWRQCISWAKESGFTRFKKVSLPCAPFHYGVRGLRKF
jgi:SAM-dependent methyltransferase